MYHETFRSAHQLPRLALLTLVFIGATALAQTHEEGARHYERGNKLYLKGDWEGAIDEFNRVIVLHSYPAKDKRAHLTNNEAAARAVEVLDPLLAAAYHNRGVAHLAKGDSEQAFADFERALAINPRLAQAYTNRATLWEAKGESEKAMADYNRAIKLDPRAVIALNNRGALYYLNGDLEKALADFEQAIHANARYSFAYANRGLVRWTRGDHAGAMTDFNQALALDARNAQAYANRGIAFLHQGESQKGQADLREAVRLNPEMKPLIAEQLDKLRGQIASLQF
jgi:tetratricopeptide (TPR) repeat protein